MIFMFPRVYFKAPHNFVNHKIRAPHYSSLKSPHFSVFLAPLIFDINVCFQKKKTFKPMSEQAKATCEIGKAADTAATGERPTKSSDISSTPMDQRLPVFQDDMRNAPHKKKNMKSNFRKRLFKKSTLETMTEEIMEILPGFLQKLHHENLCYDFCNFIKLVCNKKFPLTNISFLLFLDVVRWYSLPRTSIFPCGVYQFE